MYCVSARIFTVAFSLLLTSQFTYTQNIPWWKDHFQKVIKKEAPSEATPRTSDKRLDACVCVERYLCDANKMVITDGTGSVDFKSGDEEGCQDDQVCCTLPKDVELDSGEEKPSGVVTETTKPLKPITKTANDKFDCGTTVDPYDLKGLHAFRVSGETESTETEEGEFPWMLALVYKSSKKLICGATLITPTEALTAAQCVEDGSAEEFELQAGVYDITENGSEPPQERSVEKIVIHPSYRRKPIKFDLAILKVDTPFRRSSFVNTICLPFEGGSFEWKNCVGTGWGAGKDSHYADTKLKKARLQEIKFEDCQNRLRTFFNRPLYKLHASFLCYIGIDGEDTCKGDGGGPVSCYSISEGQYRSYLVGITSFGDKKCGTAPGAYTDVSKLADFIAKAIDK